MKNCCAAAVVLCVLGGLGMSRLHAEERQPKDPPKPDPAAAADKDKEAAKDDVYKVPEGADATALVAYCKKLMSLKLDNPVEQRAHVVKASPILADLCKKIIEMEKSDTTANGHFALQTTVMLNMAAIRNPKSPEFTTFVENATKLIEAPKIEAMDAALCLRIATNLQYVDAEKGKLFYETIAKSIAKSKDPNVTQFGPQIEGILRRLNLVGNPMELKGKTVDGKDFDLAALKGKIVLVDFWATWCGPCRAELPNVKANYEGYHNKGFDVVGVSGDQDRTQLEAFLKEEPLPWPTLHEMENGEAKENAAMTLYGITAFPTTILVGKDGKVLALNARGPKLGELLKAQLGEPEAPKEPVKDPAKADPTKPEISKPLVP